MGKKNYIWSSEKLNVFRYYLQKKFKNLQIEQAMKKKHLRNNCTPIISLNNIAMAQRMSAATVMNEQHNVRRVPMFPDRCRYYMVAYYYL